MNYLDHRRFCRACVDFPVSVEIDCGTGNKWVARALDISVGGIFVWSPHSMRLNVPLVIHFPVEWIRAFAVIKVIRRDGFYYGCEFINLAPVVVHALSRAVEHYHQSQLSKPLKTLWQQL